MKKVQLTAAILFIGWAVAFGQSKEAATHARTEFRHYISKQLNRNINVIDEHVQGTIRLKLKLSASGFDSVYVVNGINESIDAKIIQMIRNTPSSITDHLYQGKITAIDMPISFIIKDN